LFVASYTIPKTGPLGTYAVVATASFGGTAGSALQTFEVKVSWINTQAPVLTTTAVALTGAVAVAAVVWRRGHLQK